MALNYTYLKYKDTYTLENTGSVNLTYHVSKVTCEATTEIKTAVMVPGQITTLSFPVDGDYSVYLESSTQVGMPFIIKHYNHLLMSFISMVEGIVCGCSKCDECEECNKCEDYLGTLLKAQAFNTLNYPVYQNYVNQITQDSLCVFSETVLCGLLHEKVYGNPEVKEAMLRLISFYYLAFYYQDKFLAVDAEEKAYVTEKYKFDKIAACMRKLGIIPTDPLFMTTTTTTLAPSTTSTTTTSSTSTTTTPPSSTTTTTVSPCALEGYAEETTGTTTTTSTTTLAPCALEGNAEEVTGTTTTSTTTVAPSSTTTSTSTTTASPSTTTTTVPTTTSSTTTSTSTTTVPTTTTTSTTVAPTTTTSTTTTTETPTTTTTTIAGGITVPQGSQLTFPGPDSCTEITVTTYFNDGGGTLIERGICYNTTGNPSIADSKFIGPTVEGFQTVLVTGLIPNTNYYWRGYAINEVGTGYYATVTSSPTGWYLPTEPCNSTTTTSTTTTQTPAACTELLIYPPLTPGTTHTVVFLTCEWGTQETINIPYGGTMGAICVQPGGVISDNGSVVNAQTYPTFMVCIGNTTTTTTTTTTAPPAINYIFYRCSGAGPGQVIVDEANLINAGMIPGSVLTIANTIEVTSAAACYTFGAMVSTPVTGHIASGFDQCECLDLNPA